MNLLFTTILLTLFSLPRVNAATPSASPTPTTTATASAASKKIEDLKDRLATKVAELRQSERRAIYGTVKTKTISTLTVETPTKDIKIELTDDIKVFQILKGKRTALTIDDVEKNDVVTIFGQYDTAVEILKAKVIFIHNGEPLQRITGTIKEAKKTDYTITLDTVAGKSVVVDFETTTKTSLWSPEKGMEKGSFSKLVIGDTITVVGSPVPKKEDRLSALRIVNLGNLSAEKPAATPTPTEEAKNATTSGTKASPTATPKSTLTPTEKP